MNKNKARNIIGIIVISFFMITSAIIAIYSYANDLKGIVDNQLTINYLKEYFSIFSGLIGVIIGFYFGSKSNSKSNE